MNDETPAPEPRQAPPPPPSASVPSATPAPPPPGPPAPPLPSFAAYPAPPPPLGYAYPVAQPPPSKTLAVLALIFSLLPIVFVSQLAGLVLAIVHLSKSSTRHVARKMAISAVVLSVVMVFVWGGVFYAIGRHDQASHPGSGVNATNSPTPVPVQGPTTISLRDLTVGECGMQPNNLQHISAVTIVPCTRTHQFEVYAVFLLPSGPYPGVSEVSRLASQGCAARFTSYVGVPIGRSSLNYTDMHPLADGWEFDQKVRCLILTDRSQRGSLRGSKK